MNIHEVTQRLEDERQLLTMALEATYQVAKEVREAFMTTRKARIDELKHQGQKTKYCSLVPRVRKRDKSNMEMGWRRSVRRKNAGKGAITEWLDLKKGLFKKYTTDIDLDLVLATEKQFQKIRDVREAIVTARTTLVTIETALNKLSKPINPHDQEQFPVEPTPGVLSPESGEEHEVVILTKGKRSGKLIDSKKLPKLKPKD